MESEKASRRRRLRRRIFLGVLIIAAPVMAIVGWNFAMANFGTVRPGVAYRSGQMHASGLAQTIRDHSIKTVLNLRGRNADQAWYKAERAETLKAGAEQIDIAMSSCVWMSRKQMQTLIDVLQTCEKPVLIHCWRGAERTGLTSAFLTLLRDGSTIEEARAEFSLKYLFVRAGDGVVTIEHFEQYEGWLKSQGLTHSPIVFRRWVNEGYVPGKPNREEWPMDPYPLVVHTKATADGPVERELWDERGRSGMQNARKPESTTAVR